MDPGETILILDFGGQYTQLIARRVREASVYSEILPFNTPWKKIEDRHPKGIILSGGPQSVFDEDAPHPDPRVFDFQGPLLGICYGMQLMAHHFQGRVAPALEREYGRATLRHCGSSPLFSGLPEEMEVWMSHGDRIEELPGDFSVIARSRNAMAAVANESKKLFGVQFHPEVAHTPLGKEVLDNFLFKICECRPEWTMSSFVDRSIRDVREEVGEGRAVCGLSGGVDSTVAATLIHRAIGDRLTCIFVDNGLLRNNEFEKVLATFKQTLSLNVVGIDAGEKFLTELAGVEDPELKRKIIGEQFIRVFESEAKALGDVRFLVQGTLYPDVIESVSVKGPSVVIKSHHNVGGLPERMHLSLLEPLRDLFKDEVRELGKELSLPDELVFRQPFPGPGLAVRVIGKITRERLRILRDSDQIVLEEIKAADLYSKIWQSFAVLLPVKTVGVMGDGRTYENVIAIRAVTSVDGMTADWVPLPYDLLAKISNRIVNEVKGVNRVVYDISSKPPSTIEWE